MLVYGGAAPRRDGELNSLDAPVLYKIFKRVIQYVSGLAGVGSCSLVSVVSTRYVLRSYLFEPL